MNSNSDSRLSRNSAVETLMRKNTENGTKLTEMPYFPQVYAIPAEQRELEHKVLMDAVNFQPELYRQISRLPTREELKEHVADIQDIEADYMERTVKTLTEANAKTVSEMKALTEQAGKNQERYISEASSILSRMKEETQTTAASLKGLIVKIMIGTAISAVTLSVLVCVVLLKLLT